MCEQTRVHVYVCAGCKAPCSGGWAGGGEGNPLLRDLETWGEGSGTRGLSYGGQPVIQHQPVEGDERRWDHVDFSTALLSL